MNELFFTVEGQHHEEILVRGLNIGNKTKPVSRILDEAHINHLKQSLLAVAAVGGLLAQHMNKNSDVGHFWARVIARFANYLDKFGHKLPQSFQKQGPKLLKVYLGGKNLRCNKKQTTNSGSEAAASQVVRHQG